MPDLLSLPEEAALTLERLSPRLEDHLNDAALWRLFRLRLDQQFAGLFRHLFALYGDRYDFLHHLEQILRVAMDAMRDRPGELRDLDRQREADAAWFQDSGMVGGVCYVDLFAGDLQGVRERIPYLRDLGLTYLHLMPIFAAPEGENDGGYAVSDYRTVDPRLGTMEDLRQLAAELREAGISLVLDFVFNHTSDEHPWARLARAGDPTHRRFYWFFPDRQLPDAYQQTLREIFPDRRGGSFTHDAEMDAWVWTTFNSYQWDLNYRNPDVFRGMLGEMLHLANLGVEVLRMDAVAFIWKSMGSDCENQPEAHSVLRAYNSLLRLAAPAVLFKSEAIVHPEQVAEYISPEECQLSYNPLLMALLWNSLATRKVRMLRLAMRRRFAIDQRCTWVNYVRCHDDIGWTFSDEDAAELGIKGADHRAFLNEFYTGRFPGSFARGLPFGHNPRTGDCRVSGTLASLAGLESARDSGEPRALELAIRRVLLLHGVMMSVGGVPLIYLGDEVAALNDYTYTRDPARSHDSRWVHRQPRRWEAEARALADGASPQARVDAGIRRLISARKSCPAMAGVAMEVIDLPGDHVFAFRRPGPDGAADLRVVASFSDKPQTVSGAALGGGQARDLIGGRAVDLDDDLSLAPYELLWLE